MRRLGVCLLTALTLAACSDSPTGTDGTRINGTVGAFDTTEHTISASKAGQMTVTLTWGNADIDLDLYLTAATCIGYPPITCDTLRTSDGIGTNMEEVTYSVQNGEQYKVWVDNFDETRVTSYQIRVDIE